MELIETGKAPRRISLILFLVVASVLPYLNTFKNDFVGYDDQNLIQNNSQIRSLSPDNVGRMFVPRHRGNYQPIRTLSYAVDYAIWGTRPFGFHLTNFILHSVTVLGVWLLIRHLLPEPVPLLAAMIFAVHPIHVESVAWMSARKDVLSLAFFLLAVLWYEKSESSEKIVPYLASILATALALLSKLTAVTLPLCILLLEICRDGWPSAGELGRKLRRLLPHVLLVCMVVGLNFVHVGTRASHGDALVALEQVGQPVVRDVWLSMPLVVCRYVGLLFLPNRLSTHYHVARISEIADLQALVPLTFLAIIVVVGIICFLRDHKVLAFCIGWFVITFLPASNLVPTATMMTDRYMHFPSIGFAALLAMVLTHTTRKMWSGTNPTTRRFSLLPTIMIILLFSVLTVRRNTDWRNTTALFTRTLLVNPQSSDARNTLGAMYHEEGDYNSAIKMYREALEFAPGHYRFLYNLGVAYMDKGWLHQATKAFEESRLANPDFLATHFNLALSYHRQKRYEEAIVEHKESLRINPNYAASYADLGRIYVELGEYPLALIELNRAVDIEPDFIPALFDRAGLLIRLGRHEEAEQDLQRLETLGLDVGDLREKLRKTRKMMQGRPSYQ